MRRKLIFLTFFIVALFTINSNNKLEQILKLDNKNSATTISVINPVDNNDNSLEYDIVDTKPHLIKYFNNIEELKQYSDIVIEGIVKNTRNVIYTQTPFTISEIEITEVYESNNNIIKGSTICVVEPGGIMDKEFLYKKYKEKFPDKYIDINKIKPVKHRFDGMPPLDKGEHIIVFLNKYTGGVKVENCYEPVGIYYGKFYIDYNKVEHKLPKYLKDKFEDKVKTKEELINLINKTK
ncbi:hypothetical protein J2Z44_004101 [Clostridium punense]|uniref:Uncharacterized protein n=1 Tax=Clostridium punense TaxID=1054297 RepID=A0ABS4K8X7_9CLOT|nr:MULTISPECIES: hypothetical protein [Clostridium]EQB89593.1 hypothetical protein M918_19815 [Clostridium sp. BL8]MBP2024243.1 hypothetical protein [Clostridium punense]